MRRPAALLLLAELPAIQVGTGAIGRGAMGRRLVAFGFVIFFLLRLTGTAIAGGGALDVVGR